MAAKAGIGALARPLTSFIGRAGRIEEIGRLLHQHRLVTITGSGGVGKTRLAIEVATSLEATFADGAAFVDLAPVDTPVVVASAVATAIGAPDSGRAPMEDLLAEHLATRHLLVLVDNCERVADACATLFHGLLGRCPRLFVLATSRSPLGIAGEVTWRVPSLSIPPADASHDVAAVEASEAGQLLLDRARLARPGFTLCAADAPALTAICRRLDGIPLALELAASRLRAFDLGELANGLEDRFRLLSAGPRTAPPRQQTLEASIDWSYALLDETERTLFRRLGVFAAAFTVDAVEAVCVDETLPVARVLDVLATLVDQSLVNVQRSDDRTSYRLLETVREYAQLRLSESGEETALHNRHLDRILELTAWFNREADGPGLDGATGRLEPVVDDVRNAIEWSAASGRIADGLTVAADLRLFWIATRRNQEGQAWLSELFDAEGQPDVRTRTRALLAASELSLYARDPLGQIRLAGEALESARQLGDGALEAWALVLVGWAKVYVEPYEARSLLAAGRDAAAAAGDVQLVEFASYGLGTAAATTGEFEAALEALAVGIDIARTSRTLDLPYGLGQRGYVELLQGRLFNAIASLAEATSTEGGDFARVHRDLALAWLGVTLLHSGDYAGARRHLDEAISVAGTLGNQSAFATLHLGLLEAALGDHDAAADHLRGILPSTPTLGPWFEVQALVGLAAVSEAGGDVAAAADARRAAMARAETSGNPLARAVAALGLARAAELDGDAALARTVLRNGLRIADSIGYRIGAIDLLEAFAFASVDDAPDRALQLLAAVDAERTATGYARFPAKEAGYRAAVAALARAGETRTAPLAFGEAVALALRGDTRPVRPPSGWDALTPAEARVAALVAEGLSNPEIGERLFISRRTVQTHLSHAFTKLGIATRVELAALVSRSRE